MGEHLLLVLINGLINDRGEDTNIALSASQGDLGLNEFNEALNEQVLEELSVFATVVLETLSHLDTSIVLQTLHQLVCALHSSDTLFVLVLRLLNLQVALSNL